MTNSIPVGSQLGTEYIATTNQTKPQAALVAGVGLLIMAVLAGYTNFAILEGLVIKDDATRTAQNILASGGTFRLGISALALVALLDLIVAMTLFVFYKLVNKSLSLLAASLRIGYAAVFVVAISQILSGLHFLNNQVYLKIFNKQQMDTQALMKINAFYDIWNIALILFGLHLVLIGYLHFKADYGFK
jgi:hypothetical protein